MAKYKYNPYEQQTDSHLSKKFNDALFDCIMRCNITSYINEGAPHYDNLMAYYSALFTFFKNTFFLFETIPIPNTDNLFLSMAVMHRMKEIKKDIKQMKDNPSFRNSSFFSKVSDKCDDLHMLIMLGLQKRKMLVRVSEREPKGADSITYWNTKTGFQKGDLLAEIKQLGVRKYGFEDFR